MIFEEPVVEFIPLDTIDTMDTSHSGVETCKGPTSYGRNCTYYELTIMDDCGSYITVEQDADWVPEE